MNDKWDILAFIISLLYIHSENGTALNFSFVVNCSFSICVSANADPFCTFGGSYFTADTAEARVWPKIRDLTYSQRAQTALSNGHIINLVFKIYIYIYIN